MSSLPVPVSPVIITLMSVAATFWSFRKTSIIDGQAPMISPEALVGELGGELLFVGTEGAEENCVLQDERRLAGEDDEQVELLPVEEVLHFVVAEVERAHDLPLAREARGGHHARESEREHALALAEGRVAERVADDDRALRADDVLDDAVADQSRSRRPCSRASRCATLGRARVRALPPRRRPGARRRVTSR